MRMRWSMKQAQMKGRMPELSVDASEDSGVLYLCARAPFILSIVYSFRFRFVSVSFFVAFHFSFRVAVPFQRMAERGGAMAPPLIGGREESSNPHLGCCAHCWTTD